MITKIIPFFELTDLKLSHLYVRSTSSSSNIIYYTLKFIAFKAMQSTA